ncbi:hypothetical protein [Bacillus mycoides]|uniref:hypothetical protein n=1 Tax=Bacillus mycoides TaxID=1405 RepID=UPI001642E1B7|nr:hypothetical protein [Bacillus mycoides]
MENGFVYGIVVIVENDEVYREFVGKGVLVGVVLGYKEDLGMQEVEGIWDEFFV